jgi:alanyl-tRNA synthetase
MTNPEAWTSRKVRETFLSFFEEKAHTRVESSSLVPAEDPTLLFTNAGMNQFKDCFLGREKRAYTRATTSQKCVRAGGKHNDLDNVGYTSRHHTFFEMLGNFSFGDYFKKEAIDFAWELVTERYRMDPARLWATVYTDDDEAAALWARHLPRERIARFGEKDNFWSMGETGPCGPCTELHYDQGPSVPGDATPNGSGDRVMEIWNLVFMQFDRDASGKMAPLPKPSVDTGAGLERITAVLEGKNNNYDTDLFAGIIGKIEEISGKQYAGGMAVEDAPFRVVADHARAASMLVSDGVLPSNEGRGYVLRKIIRRAVRYGRRLGIEGPFLADLTAPIFESFEGIHLHDPNGNVRKTTAQTIRVEEESFRRTVTAGADRVGEAISEARREGKTTLAGAAAFRLYDTHGVPLELIEEISSDEGVRVDRAGFEKELSAARERSKGASKFEGESGLPKDDQIDPEWTTEFRGYPEQDFVNLAGAKVLGLLSEKGGEKIDSLRKGERGWCALDRTVFYPEGGGQVADQGEILWNEKGAEGCAEVMDARRAPNGKTILHLLRISSGSLSRGQLVRVEVPEWVRRRTQANHTGTHLLHAALRQVLGESVRQMGSLVAPDRLRFDYAASRPTTAGEIREIERLVNEEVLRDREVGKAVMSMDEAKKKGAMMFFGEKYGERVRVVDVPGFSTELCGGCHVGRTGEIGAFKVLSDKGLAAGVRRVEAVTSLNAIERLQKDEDILLQLSQIANTSHDELPAKLKEALDSLRKKEKEIAALKRDLALAAAGPSESSPSKKSSSFSSDIPRSDADGIVEIFGVKVLARRVPSLPTNELRNLADTFRSKLKSGVVLLGTELEGKVTLLAAVTSDLVSRVSAHELAQVMAPAVGGKGGGKPDLAQAGGKDAAQIEPALALGVAKLRERLSP